jgi:hypothetical protein
MADEETIEEDCSMYAEQVAAGQRVQPLTHCACTPFLFDADKAARDAGIAPLQPEDM